MWRRRSRAALVCLLVGALPAGCAPVAHAGQYAVIGRYACVDVATGAPRGSCDIRTDSKLSCAAALQSQRQDVAARGDACQMCVPPDPTRRWDGNPPRLTQGGACEALH